MAKVFKFSIFFAFIDRRKLVRLGEHQKSSERDCEIDNPEICSDPVQDIKISTNDLFIHPGYDPIRKWNDIALIRLNESAKITQNNINPICLPFKKSLEQLPTSMIVIGFGRTSSDNRETSDVLLKVNVKTVNTSKCFEELTTSKKFMFDISITDHQFCAGGKHIYH